MTNAFTIPEKSTVIENNRAHFPRKTKKNPPMNPIVLPGSSTFKQPETMQHARKKRNP